MRRLPQWVLPILMGIGAGAGVLLLFGYGLDWIASCDAVSNASAWLFAAKWPVLPPAGWMVAGLAGLVVAMLCRD